MGNFYGIDENNVYDWHTDLEWMDEAYQRGLDGIPFEKMPRCVPSTEWIQNADDKLWTIAYDQWVPTAILLLDSDSPTDGFTSGLNTLMDLSPIGIDDNAETAKTRN